MSGEYNISSSESSAADPSKRKLQTDDKEAPPPKVQMKIQIGAPKRKIITPIKLNLPSQSKKSEPPKKTNEKVKEVFNSDEEGEEEIIPEVARIRMRNKGRYTPTSSGPNSYGKGQYGFIDRRALLDRQTEALNEYMSGDQDK